MYYLRNVRNMSNCLCYSANTSRPSPILSQQHPLETLEQHPLELVKCSLCWLWAYPGCALKFGHLNGVFEVCFEKKLYQISGINTKWFNVNTVDVWKLTWIEAYRCKLTEVHLGSGQVSMIKLFSKIAA